MRLPQWSLCEDLSQYNSTLIGRKNQDALLNDVKKCMTLLARKYWKSAVPLFWDTRYIGVYIYLIYDTGVNPGGGGWGGCIPPPPPPTFLGGGMACTNIPPHFLKKR